ncbi:ComFC Predicted amidophosphoribosyltransferases [Candidatus Nanopelagicaceae bacterium]
MPILEDLSQLLFPTRCYGCNRLGISICTDCRREWIPHYYKTHIDFLNVHSALLYTPTASKIIMAAKESSIKGADELLISAIIHVLEKAKLDSHYFQLVPVPSSKRSQRRRGRSFIVDLTRNISEQTGISVNDCLAVSRRVSDQSGLSRIERVSNMKGAFVLKPNAIVRGELILIDDVVTTGATLREAARALNSQGFHAIGSVSAVTACVAQPLR